MDISRPLIEKPRFLEVEKFVESRANSIAQLLKAIDNESLVSGEVTKGPRTAAQRLPRHMRRRAMAYEVRRFPKGMREFAASHIISKHRKKPPSRFARRKPKNILESYARRQMSNGKWTETHIWHAKRFRMIRRWGFKIADRSYQRGFRSIIRDSKKKCVIRDVSHLTCFMIKGGDVATSMNPFCDRRCGITFSDKEAKKGRKEYSIQLYTPGQYPNGYIGPARFNWITNNETPVLCIWVHPSSTNQFKQLLVEHFALKSDEGDAKDEEGCEKLNGEQLNVEIYSSGFNRFRLFGPMAARRLAKSIRLTNNEEYRNHNLLWNQLIKSNVEVANGTILSLFVEDPRTCFDRKKSYAVKFEDDTQIDLDLYQPSTSFWDPQTRASCRKSKLDNSQYQKLNSQKIGGVQETDTKVPIIVIFRNANHSILDGIEILVPMTFGKDMWIALQRQDCRASGHRDEIAAHLEAQQLGFPFDDVDSEAGMLAEQMGKEEQLRVYNARPHNRRCQFWSALSVKYPFEYRWSELAENWGNGPPAVCRDIAHLAHLSDILKGKRVADESLSGNGYLVPVRLEFIGRGRPAKFGLICIPEQGDIQLLRRNRAAIIVQKPREEKLDSEMEVEEQEKEEVPLKLEGFVSLDAAKYEKPISLKALFESADRLEDRNVKRKRLNRKKRESAKRRKIQKSQKTEEDSGIEETYRYSACREILGRVVSGGQSILGGQGVALGYVCEAAIPRIVGNVGKCRSMVLVRNSTSKYYHPAIISVIRGNVEL